MRATNERSARGLRASGAAAIAALALISGCAADDEVRVSEAAVRATSAAFPSSDHPMQAAFPRFPLPRVSLSPATRRALSQGTNVGEEVFTRVAPELDQQPAWRLAMQRAQRAYRALPEETGQAGLNLACQAITGQITTQDKLMEAIANEAVSLGLSPSARLQFSFGVLQLAKELAEVAADPQRSEAEAAVVLFCYTFDEATG